MDEELYTQIKENLEEQLGYEPTDDEITAEYSSLCDYEYDRMRDDAIDRTGDY